MSIADTENASAFSGANDLTLPPLMDPLTDLVGRTRLNSGEPYKPEVTAALVVLQDSDRAAFERLRSDLKSAGCRVTALDEYLSTAGGGDQKERETQTAIILRLAQDFDLYHDSGHAAYADVEVLGHRETLLVRGQRCEDVLRERFYREANSAPSSEALRSAVATLAARATFDGSERTVSLRVGDADNKFYLDLSDDEWSAVEISSGGWAVVNPPPIRFRRSDLALPIPRPQRGGTIHLLRQFFNLNSEFDFILLVAWILGCLLPGGPYAVLALSGEQGTAKSTTAKLLKALLDPGAGALRNLPDKEQDLFIAAKDTHILACDNISSISPSTSDAFCRLATGGAFITRQLYSDDRLAIHEAKRPVILNGIGNIIQRHDLMDRSIRLNLAPIPEDRRRSEKELMKKFEEARPFILGAFLDAAAIGIARLATVNLKNPSRMADFETWITACETAFWPEGTFSQAYRANRVEASHEAIDSDPVAGGIRILLSSRPAWDGTAAELLEALNKIWSTKGMQERNLPGSPIQLGQALIRFEPSLRKIGITISHHRQGKERTRMLQIRSTAMTDEASYTPVDPPTSSASSASSPNGVVVMPHQIPALPISARGVHLGGPQPSYALNALYSPPGGQGGQSGQTLVKSETPKALAA